MFRGDRTVFVGDIHGEAQRLRRALSALERSSRTIVFLGDYVNRGQHSREVLDLMSEATRAGHIALLGNHDQMFLDYIDGRLPFVEFAAAGGAQTIASYVASPCGDVRQQLIRALPNHHVKFLRQLLPSYETAELVASHSGVDPADQNNRSPTVVALHGHPEIFDLQLSLVKTVICGHYSQRDRNPFISDRLICLDTGCGTGGPLTALKWPEREIAQF